MNRSALWCVKLISESVYWGKETHFVAKVISGVCKVTHLYGPAMKSICNNEVNNLGISNVLFFVIRDRCFSFDLN